ncbi:MAG TPA: radical SAM protein [Allosphingosinicella sp.]|jgi:uncharacterized protein
MKSVEWVIKASKFCNLRCAYCYEWNNLSNRERLSLAQWQRVLEAVRDYHLGLERRLGTPVESRLIWHGGEPLTLPADYLDQVMRLQHETLRGLDYRILLQSNLFSLPEAVIELLRRHDIGLGVSMDVIGGVRVDRRGRRTESAVLANLDRLDRLGISYGAITVLAKHNLHRLRDVHDFWLRRGAGFRVLPLFEGPGERPSGSFEASDEELVAALCDLFDYWLGQGAQAKIFPLAEWLGNVLRAMLGQRSPVYDRRLRGESVLQVETNGDLFLTDERGHAEWRLGNVIKERIDRILASRAYSDSLARSEAKTAQFCHGCPHYGFCNGYPVHAEPFTRWPAVGCPVTAAVHDHIERTLLAAGYDAETLAGLMWSASGAAQAGAQRTSDELRRASPPMSIAAGLPVTGGSVTVPVNSLT